MNAIVGLWLGPTFVFLLTRRGDTGQYLPGLFADDPGRVGWLLLGYSVVFASGVLAWSVLLDRIPRKTVLYVSLAAMLAVCAGLFLFNHSQSWLPVSRWAVLSVTAAFVMVESGFTPAALALLADVVGPQAGRGSAMGIYSALLGVGALAGSVLAGLLGTSFAVDGLIFGTMGLALVALVAVKSISVDVRGAVHG
jgi:MFS family permease